MEKKKNHTTAGSDRPKDICVPTQDAESFQGRTIKLSIDESTDTEIPQVLFRTDPYTIDLSGEIFDVVNAYVTWLYIRKLAVLEGTPLDVFEYLADAFVFGERIVDIEFKNDVMDSIIVQATGARDGKIHLPGSSSMNRIFSGTVGGSPARRLMVDFFVDGVHDADGFWEHDVDLYSEEVLRDMLKGMREKRRLADRCPWKNDCANYHEEEVVESAAVEASDSSSEST
ncbi:hypothetical protein PMIN07_007341 [Paraphaeosphaeria minitans]